MQQIILRRPAVQERTGLGRSQLYRLMQAGVFPKPLKLSERCSGWLASEIDDWIEARRNDRDRTSSRNKEAS